MTKNKKKKDGIKPCILVVDDEKDIRDMLRRHFTFLDYDVEVADNGKTALERMSRKRCDIVISDLKMPVMDGIFLLKEIRAQYPMVHCIMITGYVSMDNVLSCMKQGADTCIFKPLEDMRELEEAVKRAVDNIAHWQNKLKTLLKMKPE